MNGMGDFKKEVRLFRKKIKKIKNIYKNIKKDRNGNVKMEREEI